LTDLPNGTVSINAGLGGNETAIRPITEQEALVGVVDDVNDFVTIYDASTQKHVKVSINALGKDLYRDRGMSNVLMTLAGVASLSDTNFLKWTSSFFILGGGRGAGTLSTAGFYQISMPPVGTVISRVGGGNNITVTAEGIQMRDPSTNWSVLYYILNPGGSNFNSANFRLAGYQSDFIVPDNWVMIATYNADISTVKIGNGQILGRGYNTNPTIELYRDRGMPNILMTLSGIASLDSTAFLKWTSKFTIRGGGRGIGTISTDGFYDIVMPPVGTNIQGVGGAAGFALTAAGFRMNNQFGNWSTLYYILPTGAGGSNNANFRVVGFGGDFVVPDNWVVVATYNADRNNVKLGNGQILEVNSTSASGKTINPATPVLVASGPGFSIINQSLNSIKSTSGQVTYEITANVKQDASIGWSILTVPNIVGFQNPEVSVVSMTRNGLNYEGVKLPQRLISASFANGTIFLNDLSRTGNYLYEMIIRISYYIN
jgi:hypothetical protein